MRVQDFLSQAGYQACDKVTSWDDLPPLLDAHTSVNRPPVPERTPLGAPPLERSWKTGIRNRVCHDKKHGLPAGRDAGWIPVVERRRKIAMVMTVFASIAMSVGGFDILKSEHASLFVMVAYMFCNMVMEVFMISMFCQFCVGTYTYWRGAKGNPWHPIHTACDPNPNSKVAITFPVYHEDVARVAAGMAAVWESLAEHCPDSTHHYDIFLLSDSRKLSYWVAEKAAVAALQKRYPNARFFYRWRTSNDNAKLGNIIDFCRRWGTSYDYMFSMDADSVMSGETIHATLRMMEGNHRLGILQTNPTPILRTSFFGRMQQFGGRLYGAVFTYAMQSMYMGHASYIGHNAIIRTKPFMDHCMLPHLSGEKPWGGKPLSHDIVEAAMMTRAGYEVWFLPELQGSWEEVPSNIIGFMVRARRWMQGNLQHLRFLLTDGMPLTHQERFVTGMMGYVNAPIWKLFFLLSVYTMVSFFWHGMQSFKNTHALHLMVHEGAMVLGFTLSVLFLSRILALAKAFPRKTSRLYGGKFKMVVSAIIETLFSIIFVPVVMIYFSYFLFLWAKRKSVSWGTQQRDDEPLPWSVCWRTFGWVFVLGVMEWGLIGYGIACIPQRMVLMVRVATHGVVTPLHVMLWMIPVLGSFVFSPWVARMTSKTYQWMIDKQYFAIPEEIEVPHELTVLAKTWDVFKHSLPCPEDEAACLAFASTPEFYRAHRETTRYRPHVAQRLLPKIKNDEPLTARELAWCLRERQCYDAWVAHQHIS